MENLLMACIIEENEFSVTNQRILLWCSHSMLKQTNSSQVMSKYVSEHHILICMLNIVICRTCSGVVLAPVSPIHNLDREGDGPI